MLNKMFNISLFYFHRNRPDPDTSICHRSQQLSNSWRPGWRTVLSNSSIILPCVYTGYCFSLYNHMFISRAMVCSRKTRQVQGRFQKLQNLRHGGNGVAGVVSF